MKLLIDFFPIALFFLTYKLYGIYTATAVAVGATIIQVVGFWLWYRRIETMHIVTLILIAGLGGLTLLLHNDLFIKWKPTCVYWAFSLVFIGYHFFTQVPLIKKMMGQNITLPEAIWWRLNHMWAVFFLVMGVINLFVVYHFDTDTWVNFKLFGGLGLTLLFVLIQAIYLSRHVALESD